MTTRPEPVGEQNSAEDSPPAANQPHDAGLPTAPNTSAQSSGGPPEGQGFTDPSGRSRDGLAPRRSPTGAATGIAVPGDAPRRGLDQGLPGKAALNAADFRKLAMMGS